jgi:hypothetical protein
MDRSDQVSRPSSGLTAQQRVPDPYQQTYLL